MHLSQSNNRPELVERELSAVLAGSGVRLEISSQHWPLAVDAGPEQLSLFPEQPEHRSRDARGR
jgi:hypothetical protein